MATSIVDLKAIADRRKKIIVRVIILGLIGEMIALAAAVYLMSPAGKGWIERLKNIPEPVLMWLGIGFAVFFIIAFILGVRNSRVTPPEFAAVADELGISITRNSGPEGTSGRWGFFGVGQFFEANFRGNILSYSIIVGENTHTWGTRLALHHARPLSLGLLCKYRGSPFTTPGRSAGEFKDVFAEELDIGEEGLKVYAVDKEKASLLFNDQSVRKALDAFREQIGRLQAGDGGIYSRCAFVISDKTIAVFLPEPSLLEKQLIEAMSDLSISIVNSGFIPAVPVVRMADRIYKTVVVCLVIITAVVSILALWDWLPGLLRR